MAKVRIKYSDTPVGLPTFVESSLDSDEYGAGRLEILEEELNSTKKLLSNLVAMLFDIGVLNESMLRSILDSYEVYTLEEGP